MKGKAYFETKDMLYDVTFESGQIKKCSRISKIDGERADFATVDLPTLLDLSEARQLQRATFLKKLGRIENDD